MDDFLIRLSYCRDMRYDWTWAIMSIITTTMIKDEGRAKSHGTSNLSLTSSGIRQSTVRYRAPASARRETTLAMYWAGCSSGRIPRTCAPDWFRWSALSFGLDTSAVQKKP